MRTCSWLIAMLLAGVCVGPVVARTVWYVRPEPKVDLTPVDFTRLGTRPLSMGGAWCAYGPDEQALFHNPATLARLKLPRFGTSHSARHFPGPVERDQLDADPTALIWPLTPLFTVGQGWVTQGELGYAHHDLADHEFPVQHLWGTERLEAIAWDLALVQAGVSHRTQSYRYAHGPTSVQSPALEAPTQMMSGEGTTIGFTARPFPGIDLGWSQEKLDQDHLMEPNLRIGKQDSFGVARTTTASGWAIHPTGWLTIAGQTDQPQYRTIRDGEKTKTADAPIRRWGIECWLGPWLAIRGGLAGEHRSWGATLALPLLPVLHYGEAEDLMQSLSLREWPDKFANTHHYSWSLGL